MKVKRLKLKLSVILSGFFTLACGSIQIGVVITTAENAPIIQADVK
jgi:hypothetical protein